MSYPIDKASFYIGAAMHTRLNWVKAELYMGGVEAKGSFGRLIRQREAIERELGYSLEWEQLPTKIACRICRYLPDADLKKRDDWKRSVPAAVE